MPAKDHRCRRCGTPVTRGQRGPWPTYCSSACRQRQWYRNHVNALPLSPHERALVARRAQLGGVRADYLRLRHDLEQRALNLVADAIQTP
jgi:hypothetical protein